MYVKEYYFLKLSDLNLNVFYTLTCNAFLKTVIIFCQLNKYSKKDYTQSVRGKFLIFIKS